MLIENQHRNRPTPKTESGQEIKESSLLGLYVLQRGCFSYVNAQLAGILGYSDAAPLIGKSLWELIVPEDHGRVKLRAETEKADTGPNVQPVRMFKQNGTTIRVCLKGDNTLYQGRPANIGCMIDLTSLELMRAALEKYRLMISQVNDAVAEMDLNGNLIFSNTSVCRRWKTLGDKTKPLNFRTYVDENSVDAFIKGYRKVYESGLPGKNIVYQVKLADGTRLTVEDSVSPMRDETGAITGVRIISRNITDRIAAEKKTAQQRTQLEAIFRSVNDAIITVDPALKILEANRAAETICGLDKKEGIGELFSTGPPACRRSCLEVLQQTIDNKKAFKEYKMVCGHTQRRRQTVSLSSSPLLAPDGRFIGAVMVARDITHMQNMERELHQRHQYKSIVGKSQKIKDVFGMVERLADLDTTVLLTGESGTGKELIAKALHYSGRRAHKPFVSVNCSALNENLLESELFGHAKGAFTGALRDKQGRFEAAQGGTLLLDEIGDVAPLIQLRLLRVLQEKTFERVGESNSRQADVRIIASTNKDLTEKIRKGAFRQDFYYRLKVVQIHLPTLRQRVDDIPLLMDHFRVCFNKRFNKRIKGFSKNVRHRFMSYTWPGNVRELEHLIERAFVLCRGSEIRMAHLPLEMDHDSHRRDTKAYDVSDELPEQIREIVELLIQTQWNKSKVAQVLGVSRQTLYRKIREYHIYG